MNAHPVDEAMCTRRVALRALREEDYVTIFQWRNRPSYRFNVMGYDDVVTFEEFTEQMHRFGLIRPFRYMVSSQISGHDIGFTYARDHSEDGASCFLNVYIEDGAAGHGYGVDVFGLMARFLLREAGVEQIFADVFSYNTMSLSTLRSSRLREWVLTEKTREHGGTTYPMHRFEVTGTDLDRIEEMLSGLDVRSGSGAAHVGSKPDA